MTEDFGYGEDDASSSSKGLGLRGSDSIPPGSSRTPSGRSGFSGGKDSGTVSSIKNIGLEALSYVTGIESEGRPIGFTASGNPQRSGDHEVDRTKVSRRGFVQVLGVGAAGLKGVSNVLEGDKGEGTPAGENYNSTDEDPKQTTMEEETPGETVPKYETRSPVEIPGPAEGEGVVVTDDEIYEWNQDLYADMVDEQEWNVVEDEPGPHKVYLRSDGDVIIADIDDEIAREFTYDEFNLSGSAYNGPEGRSLSDLYDQVTE